MCFGLAWTPFGGEVLVVETSLSEGQGKIELTGSLGSVLQESVRVALSWIRANASMLNVSPDLFNYVSHKQTYSHSPFPE